MRFVGWIIWGISIVATGGVSLSAQEKAVVPQTTAQPRHLSEIGLAGLVCFGSVVSYAIFGMPKSRRFTRIIGGFGPTGRKHLRTRRALELLAVAVTGGLAGYYLMSPSNGGAAITAGAMWYGALYRIAQDGDDK